MSINYEQFIHPADKKAFSVLKAIPGFEFIVKKIMSLWSEKTYQIETSSSYLKLGPYQMPEIYNLLVKVCKKLEINIPELYLKLDRSLNAETYGDTDITIVLNSGLLETMTPNQIETIIAHECGHIVCHHVLYNTIGNILINGASYGINKWLSTGTISKIATDSLIYAYSYWSRCCEFSADRVAAYYHSSAEPVIDIMMALAGGTTNLNYPINKEEFLKQASNYKSLIENSNYNKALEFMLFGDITHPLTVYRAYEAKEFWKNYSASKIAQLSPKVSATTDDYNLRIHFYFLKSKPANKNKNKLIKGSLEICVDNKKYSINKNDTIDINLSSGNYEITIETPINVIRHSISLQDNIEVIISYDSNTNEINIK